MVRSSGAANVSKASKAYQSSSATTSSSISGNMAIGGGGGQYSKRSESSSLISLLTAKTPTIMNRADASIGATSLSERGGGRSGPKSKSYSGGTKSPTKKRAQISDHALIIPKSSSRRSNEGGDADSAEASSEYGEVKIRKVTYVQNPATKSKADYTTHSSANFAFHSTYNSSPSASLNTSSKNVPSLVVDPADMPESYQSPSETTFKASPAAAKKRRTPDERNRRTKMAYLKASVISLIFLIVITSSIAACWSAMSESRKFEEDGDETTTMAMSASA